MIAGYDAGAVDYLTKPVNSQVLRHKIAVFAELFRKTRELAELNEKLEERVKERTLELERSEAALRAAAQQKDEFLAILAHELRNPLGPLRSGLDLLLRRKEAEPVIARTLGTMNRQLHHMVRLIDDLLDISRVSRGLLELKKAPVDLGEVLATTVESLRPMFEQHHQQLTLENAETIEALADSTRVAQIVTNLLTNASKFTPEERPDHRRAAARGRSGADPGHRHRRRDPGRIRSIASSECSRGSNGPTPTVPMGLGIGLALARRLAEMHGGDADRRQPRRERREHLHPFAPRLTKGADVDRAGATAEGDGRSDERSAHRDHRGQRGRRRIAQGSAGGHGAYASGPPSPDRTGSIWFRRSAPTSCCAISGCLTWAAWRSVAGFAPCRSRILP